MTDQLRDGRPPYLIIEHAALLDPRMTGSHFVIYAALIMHAGKDDTAWPSVRRLAEIGCMSKRKADMVIADLVRFGYIRVDARHDASGRQTSNLYTIRDVYRREGAPHAPTGVHHMQGEGAPHAPELESLELEPKEPVRGKPARTQDPLFDWIAANLFGNPEKITRGLGSRIGKVIKELPDDVTIDDLNRWELWYSKKNIDLPRDGVKLAASIREWRAQGNVTRGLHADLQRHGITPTGNPVFDSRLLERARRNHA
jgi:hypothetical protein